jgi:hypothetical protein
MYYEEMWIGGVLHSRTAPTADWKPKVTDWFPPDVKPVHIGKYECQVCGDGGQHKWDGENWVFNDGTHVGFNFHWRGLSEKPQ